MRCFWRHFRLHDTVIIGGHGPKQVVQHHGANEYQFKIDDLKTVLESRDPGMVRLICYFWTILKTFFLEDDLHPLVGWNLENLYKHAAWFFFFCLSDILGENNIMENIFFCKTRTDYARKTSRLVRIPLLVSAIILGHLLHTNLNCECINFVQGKKWVDTFLH